CDSGFGHLIAKSLNQYGFNVIAACLFPDGEGAKSLQLESKFPDNLTILKMDVTKDEDIEIVHKEIENLTANGIELWGLVNNAGIARAGEIEWGSFEFHFKQIFEVNTMAVIKITRKFLPLLRKSKGRVINMCSSFCRFTVDGSVAYAMTKHAIASFSDGLRREMSKFGVKVVNIEPFFYSTNIIKNIDGIIRETWEQTDASIRDDYSIEYLKDRVYFVKNIALPLFERKKPEEVSNAVVDSLTSRITEPKFTCSATLLRPLIALLHLLPLEVVDLLFISSLATRFPPKNKKN
ncbi:D-beta-hydroxybutyrate dehydrogenase-like protein, partial [Dinothrombium tinctorium]